VVRRQCILVLLAYDQKDNLFSEQKESVSVGQCSCQRENRSQVSAGKMQEKTEKINVPERK